MTAAVNDGGSDQPASHLRTFARTTTIKGVSRVLNSPTTFLRVLWVTFLILGASMTAYQTYISLSSYTGYEVITKVATVDSKPEFPDISICGQEAPSSLDYSLDNDLFTEFITAVYNIADILHTKSLNVTEEEWAEFQRSVTAVTSANAYFQTLPIASEWFHFIFIRLIAGCSFYGWNKAGIKDLDCELLHTVRFMYADGYFPCFTISVPEEKRYNVSGLSVVVNMDDMARYQLPFVTADPKISIARSVRVLVHQRGTLPVMSEALSLPVGAETVLQVHPTAHKHLGKPYGDCTDRKYLFPDKDDTEGRWPKFVYTKDSCEGICMQEAVMEQCACVGSGLPFTSSQVESGRFCANLTSRMEMRWTEWPGMTPRTMVPVPHANISLSDVINAAENTRCAQRLQNKMLKDVTCAKNCSTSCFSTHYMVTSSSAPWPQHPYRLAVYNKYIRQRRGVLLNNYSRYEEARQLCMSNRMREGNKIMETLTLVEEKLLTFRVSLEDKSFSCMEELPKWRLIDVIGNLGGVWNLWIGISYITFCELLDVLCKVVCNWFKGSSSRNTKINRINVEPV